MKIVTEATIGQQANPEISTGESKEQNPFMPGPPGRIKKDKK